MKRHSYVDFKPVVNLQRLEKISARQPAFIKSWLRPSQGPNRTILHDVSRTKQNACMALCFYASCILRLRMSASLPPISSGSVTPPTADR